jgi:hypothetical protein
MGGGRGLYLVIKALLVILPVIVQLVQSGRIKTAAYDELMSAFNVLFDARIKAAQKAAKETTNEATDPNNRSR